MGLVIIPDIFGLRPLFEEMVARFAQEWNMAVIAFEPFPGRTFSDDVAERFAAMSQLDDDVIMRDAMQAADALGVERVGLIGYCMGGMYCHKAAQHERFARIASFYGMIHVPSDWAGPKQAEPISCLKAGNADRVLAIIGSQGMLGSAVCRYLSEEKHQIREQVELDNVFTLTPNRKFTSMEDLHNKN